MAAAATDARGETRVPWLGIFFISGCAVGYEILLIRLFGIVQWYHYGYMMISLALLGHGASGTFVFLFQKWLLQHYRAVFLVNGLLFAAASLFCFLLAQIVPFNNLALLWDGRQWLWLMAIYALLLVPFLLAANCIALTLCRFGDDIPGIYGCDLLGAALGAAATVLLLYLVEPVSALLTLSVTSLVICAIVSRKWLPNSRTHWLILGLAIVIFNLPESWLQLRPATYKPLSKALLLPGAKVVETRSSPLGLLDVVESPVVPFRNASGISIHSRHPIPEQLAIFKDAGSFSTISRFDGNQDQIAYVDDLVSALPFHLLEQPKVLILGLGGGEGIRQAAFQGADEIEVIELNAQRTQLVLDRFHDYAGWQHLSPQPQVYHADPRGYLTSHDKKYDLIQLNLIGGSGGLASLQPGYGYTEQAFQLILDHLNDNGLVTIRGEIELPPRSSLRTLATAIAVLGLAGKDPSTHIAMIRGWKSWIVVVSNQPLEQGMIAEIRKFSTERGFDTAYYPGITRGDSNQFSILREDHFFNAAEALLGTEPEKFLERYKFRIEPVSDDRPYFFQFLKWSLVEEWLTLRDRGGMALLDSGFPVLIATLVQAIVFSVLLVVLPLVLNRSTTSFANRATGMFSVFGYFFLVGLAFIMIEIAFIQKLLLFLSHPGFSIPVALAAFLLFAGLGSLWVRKHSSNRKIVAIACTAVVAVSLVYLLLLPPLFALLLPLPIGAKAFIALGCIAPLAFFMGMPFPAGLNIIKEHESVWLPWCWGINGCASVISAVLSMAIAIQFGFTFTILLAAIFYMMAVVAVNSIPAVN